MSTRPYFIKPLLKRKEDQLYPVWTAEDKAHLAHVARKLGRGLPRSPACTHVQGNGGLKGAVRAVQGALGQHRYVFCTDVKSYCASIDHHKLMDHVTDRDTLNLLWQYMRRTVQYGGTFQEITRGIPGGAALSPLIGAFHLHDLDVAVTTQHKGCFYIRYMDDILILAPTRGRLRRAIAAVRQHFGALGLELHPDKTAIGPIARGFDFLGYHHDPSGLRLAAVTRQRHLEKLTGLYERYQRRLRAYRKALVGQSTIPHRHDPARAYLKPQPVITSLKDIFRPTAGLQRRFDAWASGGLKTCDLDY